MKAALLSEIYFTVDQMARVWSLWRVMPVMVCRSSIRL